ncbi:MAG: NifB/NifX family molybdenum-iron cluster-binding protein [Deltaproteobacteria bacterium]|nr:NifB/NifX family molybdenum-iron cluster-binding protein [Deltaproteobacteria bacterium]
MRIAIPIWDNKVSPVMDTASRLLIIETDGHKESARFEIYLEEQDISRRCHRIQGLEIDVLICGAICRSLAGMLLASDIHIISEISGLVEDVLEAYLQGTLADSKFFMPGATGNKLRQTKTKGE